ncbi:MAG: DUF3553 domain-containing protein [Deltaproteobacteria bacterium]|nr:DUF3553 domain-containing protein [Deltaproteobacteria bacterium]
MYVAATRARDRLIFPIRARSRSPCGLHIPAGARGSPHSLPPYPGIFSTESGSASDTPPMKKRPVRRRPAGTFQNPKDNAPYTQGEQVKHPAFGMGVVSRMVSDNKIEVFFKNGGKKLLHLEYTVLEKI